MSRNKQRRERSDQAIRRRIGNLHASMDAGGLIARRRFLHQGGERAAQPVTQ